MGHPIMLSTHQEFGVFVLQPMTPGILSVLVSPVWVRVQINIRLEPLF